MANAPELLHVFSTFCAAGPQVRTVNLIRALGERYAHTIIAMDGATDAFAALEDLPYCRLEERPAPLGGPLGKARAFAKRLKRQRPDLLLTYNWGAMDAVLGSRLRGRTALLHHEDGFNLDEAERLKPRRNWTRRLALSRASVLVPSRKLEAIARETWAIRDLTYIANGVELARFTRDSAGGRALRAELGVPPEALVVGAVGHLRPVKNYERLVRAVAQVDPDHLGGRPLHLVIFGDGPQRAAIEAQAQATPPPADGRVHLPGFRTDLAIAYSSFDLFTISSDSEQQPVSLLEAMACGCPVAATDVGDVQLTLGPTAGAGVVPLGPSVEPTLASAIGELLADVGRRETLAAAGLERVREEYSLRAMAASYDALYQRCLG